MVERAMQSRELKRAMGTLIPKKQILKVAGKEEYLLEDKALSCYKVCVCNICVCVHAYI